MTQYVMQIYKTTNKINGMIYVGKEGRASKKYFGSGKLIKLAIDEFGIENFEKEVLEICETKQELNEREKFWIGFYGCQYPNGYNIMAGGQAGDVFTHNPFADELRANLSECAKKRVGEKNTFYGKKHSEESKNKMREGQIRARERNPHDSNVCNCASCKSIRGEFEENPMLGRHHTKESKEKMSVAKKGKSHAISKKGEDCQNYIFVDADTREKIFKLRKNGLTMREIGVEVGLSYSKVRKILLGKDVL